MSEAIHTMHTYLMVGSGTPTVYSKLVDVSEVPDLWTAPSTIDTTTLSDEIRTYINGLVDTGNLEFTCNYTMDNMDDLDDVAGIKGTKFAVWLGANGSTPDGHNGKFSFTGELSYGLKAVSVDDKVQIGISIAVSSEIVMETMAYGATLNKSSVAGSSTVTVSSIDYAPEAPSVAPTAAYLWQVSEDGNTWTDLTGTYTGYNTATLTAKSTDAGKLYRCKVTLTGSIAATVYSGECIVTE